MKIDKGEKNLFNFISCYSFYVTTWKKVTYLSIFAITAEAISVVYCYWYST